MKTVHRHASGDPTDPSKRDATRVSMPAPPKEIIELVEKFIMNSDPSRRYTAADLLGGAKGLQDKRFSERPYIGFMDDPLNRQQVKDREVLGYLDSLKAEHPDAEFRTRYVDDTYYSGSPFTSAILGIDPNRKRKQASIVPQIAADPEVQRELDQRFNMGAPERRRDLNNYLYGYRED